MTPLGHRRCSLSIELARYAAAGLSDTQRII
jgi:hypothetical protein